MRARSAVTADTVRKCGARFSCRLFLYLLRSNLIATLVSIVAGVFTYATLLLMLKGLTEQEILRFPKGRTLVKLARKMHLLR